MPYDATVYRILIASPSDVFEERNVISDLIISWNSTSLNNIVMLPVKWETHSVPEMGDRPQAIINRQIVVNSDILIGIFWTRIGTNTGVSESGTVEEIDEFIKSGKPVMLYFSNREVNPGNIDIQQYEKLRLFKAKCESMGLIDNFLSIEDLKEKIYRHITSFANKIGLRVSGSESSINDNLSERLKDFKSQASQIIFGIKDEWNAERDSEPYSIDLGKELIYNLGLVIIKLKNSFRDIISDKIAIRIDDTIKQTRILQKHEVSLDGVSYNEFWINGTSLINEFLDVVNSIDESQNSEENNKIDKAIKTYLEKNPIVAKFA